MASIPFIDLEAQQRRLGTAVTESINNVLTHGKFIMGPEVAQFEQELCDFCGSEYAVGCGNGTDALQLAIMASEIGAGDAVFVPSFTFVATAEAVVMAGATPIFTDVENSSFNMDSESLLSAIDVARDLGLRPAAVIPVDLFGQPADYAAINQITDDNDMITIADAAQSFGARKDNASVGTLAHLTTTSFFPAKPLGCYGDGGAVFCNDEGIANVLRSLRVHGKGTDKYDNIRVGINSRLDTIQAAILLQKLAIFPEELIARQAIAERYNKALGNIVQVPRLEEGNTSAWAQYTILVPGLVPARDKIAARLRDQGIPTAIYYGKPLHLQEAYLNYPVASAGLSVSEALAGAVLSLPMHPYLEEAVQDQIILAVRELCAL